MDSKSFNIWFICDHCTRGYNNVDRLIDHKNEAHPEIYSAMLKEHKKRGKKRKKGVTFDLDEMSDEDLKKQLKRSNAKKVTEGQRKGGRKPKRRRKSLTLRKKSHGSANIDVKNAVEVVEDVLFEKQQNSPQILPIGEDVLYAQSLEAAAKMNTEKTVPLDNPQKSPISAQLDKDKLNAFNLLFKQQLSKKNTPKRDRSSARITANKDKSSSGPNSSPGGDGKFPCPQCSRSLEDAAALKLHVSLHQAIKLNKPKSAVKMVSVPCEQCGREILCRGGGIFVSSGTCNDCANAKMVFDIPPTIVKEEPQDVNERVEEEEAGTEMPVESVDAIHADTESIVGSVDAIHGDTQSIVESVAAMDADTQLIVESVAIDVDTQVIPDNNFTVIVEPAEIVTGNFTETSEYWGTTAGVGQILGYE